MNKILPIAYKQVIVVLYILSFGVYGQEETKTLTESFNVVDDAVLEVNTSHADIEFETWNKNEVLITATITLEGATPDEANEYFGREPIEIYGNSKKITISSELQNISLFNLATFDVDDVHMEMPDIMVLPEIANLEIEVPEIVVEPLLLEVPEPPAYPHHKAYEFDYKAYKKDGEKYLKEWQKKFDESFDDEYHEKMEKWSKQLEERREEAEKKRAKREKERKHRIEEFENRAQKRAKGYEKRVEEREKAIQEKEKARAEKVERVISIKRSRNGDNNFYMSSGGKHRKFKVKKTLKIKLPKSAKIKMNVRHGEVKLAENTKNMNATLTHSSLSAATIDGDNTIISASYTPVNIEKWNYGKLRAKYSDDVTLQEVLNINLVGTSSNITINKLLKSAHIDNQFGVLEIKSVSDDFEKLTLNLRNAELLCEMPTSAFNFTYKGSSSSMDYPVCYDITEEIQDECYTVYSGYNKHENGASYLVIKADYSKVALLAK